MNVLQLVFKKSVMSVALLLNALNSSERQVTRKIYGWLEIFAVSSLSEVQEPVFNLFTPL